MKYIEALYHDDQNTLQLISQITDANSYPELRNAIARVWAEYQHYIEVRGDAWQLNEPMQLINGLGNALKNHYDTQPADLEIIKRIRDEASPDVCPMCGSPKTSQVDHLAPRDTYPEFSFFTRNLVPSCDCNGFKKLTFKGPLVGQRVLHPYYDTVMQQRLAYVEFADDFEAPMVEIRVHDAFRDDLAVNFHVDKILRKTRLLHWAGAKWAAIQRRPESVFPLMQNHPGPLTSAVVHDVIQQHVQAKDDEFGTPNNWDSMVYGGILISGDATEYIARRVNGLRNNQIFPI